MTRRFWGNECMYERVVNAYAVAPHISDTKHIVKYALPNVSVFSVFIKSESLSVVGAAIGAVGSSDAARRLMRLVIQRGVKMSECVFVNICVGIGAQLWLR